MGDLAGWGALATAILAVECMVLNLLFVALAAGMWFGTRWIRLRTGSGLQKVGGWLDLGQRYIRQGQSLVVAPFVRLRGQIEGARTAWNRLKE